MPFPAREAFKLPGLSFALRARGGENLSTTSQPPGNQPIASTAACTIDRRPIW
jgi:hypothetical protein